MTNIVSLSEVRAGHSGSRFKSYRAVEADDGRRVGMFAGIGSLMKAAKAREEARTRRGEKRANSIESTDPIVTRHPLGFEVLLILGRPSANAEPEEIDSWLEAHFVESRQSFLSATIQLSAEQLLSSASRFGREAQSETLGHSDATALLSKAIAAKRQSYPHPVPSYGLVVTV